MTGCSKCVQYVYLAITTIHRPISISVSWHRICRWVSLDRAISATMETVEVDGPTIVRVLGHVKLGSGFDEVSC